MALLATQSVTGVVENNSRMVPEIQTDLLAMRLEGAMPKRLTYVFNNRSYRDHLDWDG